MKASRFDVESSLSSFHATAFFKRSEATILQALPDATCRPDGEPDTPWSTIDATAADASCISGAVSVMAAIENLAERPAAKWRCRKPSH
jgi:hypothetical protein